MHMHNCVCVYIYIHMYIHNAPMGCHAQHMPRTHTYIKTLMQHWRAGAVALTSDEAQWSWGSRWWLHSRWCWRSHHSVLMLHKWLWVTNDYESRMTTSHEWYESRMTMSHEWLRVTKTISHEWLCVTNDYESRMTTSHEWYESRMTMSHESLWVIKTMSHDWLCVTNDYESRLTMSHEWLWVTNESCHMRLNESASLITRSWGCTVSDPYHSTTTPRRIYI